MIERRRPASGKLHATSRHPDRNALLAEELLAAQKLAPTSWPTVGANLLIRAGRVEAVVQEWRKMGTRRRCCNQLLAGAGWKLHAGWKAYITINSPLTA